MKIKSIKIETADGKNVEINVDDARKLHRELDGLFGPKEITYIPYVPYQPTVPSWPRWPEITCWGNGTAAPSWKESLVPPAVTARYDDVYHNGVDRLDENG